MKNDEIMKREYREEFDEMRKNRVLVSFHKYGPAAINFGQRCVSAIGSLKKCLDKYEETGNTEYLLDAGNYAMFEYMYPQHQKAHFRPTDSSESAGIDGISIKEMEEYK